MMVQASLHRDGRGLFVWQVLELPNLEFDHSNLNTSRNVIKVNI